MVMKKSAALLVMLLSVFFAMQATPAENNYTINNQTPFHLLIAFNKIDGTNALVQGGSSNNMAEQVAARIPDTITHGALEASATYVPPNTTSTVNTGGYCNHGYWIIPAVPAGASLPTVSGNGITWLNGVFTTQAPLAMLLNQVGASTVTWIQESNEYGNSWADAGSIGLKVQVSQARVLTSPCSASNFTSGLTIGGTSTAQCPIQGGFSATYQPFTGYQCANRNITLTYDSATNTITTSNGYGAASVINHDYVS
jgi:hypothetical protein